MSNIGHPIYYPVGNTIGVISSLGFSGAVPEIVALFFIDFTRAPSSTNKLDDYGLATSRTVTDYNGRIVQIPADAVPMGGLRPVYDLYAKTGLNVTSFLGGWSTGNSAAPTAAGFDFTAGVNGYMSHSPATFGTTPAGTVFAARVSVTSDVDVLFRIVLRNATDFIELGTLSLSAGVAQEYAGSATQITAGDCYLQYQVVSPTADGSITLEELQAQDITHRADLSTAPDEFVSTDDDYGTGVNGFRYFDTELNNSVASNVVTEGTGASIAGWLDYQPGDTNYADSTHDFSGGADTITLTATGYYTLWLEGTAQVTIAAGTATITGAGAATEGSPVTINCTATGTITLTLDSGTLDEWGAYQIIQLNGGTVPTAFIPTSGTSASRPAMSPAPTISGLVGTEDARVTVKGLAADNAPNLDTWSSTDAAITISDAGGIVADGTQTASEYAYVNMPVQHPAGTRHFIVADVVAGSGVTVRLGVSASGKFVSYASADAGETVSAVLEQVASLSRIYVGFASGQSATVNNVRVYAVDPTDTTERIIDLNNVDGEFDQFDAAPFQILSIDVYNDGERPA